MGERVLVFGGYRYENGDKLPVKPLGDGAVFDVAAGTWAELPRFPLAAPFRQTAGVWTGSEAVLLGTPCQAASGEEGEFDCRPGGIAAAAFSPATGKWRTIKGVRAPEGFAASTGNAVESTGLGWTGAEAVFSVSNANAGSSTLLVDVDGGSSRWAPDVQSADAKCVVGSRLLAVRTGSIDANGGILSPNPEAVAQPLRTSEFDGEGWKSLPEVVKPDSVGASFERVYCGDGQLAYLPVKPPPEGFGSGGLWWDSKKMTWQPLPKLGTQGFPGEARIADVSDTKVIWIQQGSVASLPAGTDHWVVRPAPTNLPVRIANVGGKLLVDTTTSEADKQLTIGFIDLERLTTPAG